jgi:hypothetical protein
MDWPVELLVFTGGVIPLFEWPLARFWTLVTFLLTPLPRSIESR